MGSLSPIAPYIENKIELHCKVVTNSRYSSVSLVRLKEFIIGDEV